MELTIVVLLCIVLTSVMFGVFVICRNLHSMLHNQQIMIAQIEYLMSVSRKSVNTVDDTTKRHRTMFG